MADHLRATILQRLAYFGQTTGMMTENRLGRESKFHDEAFTENTRAVAAAFYSVATVSRGAYHSLIREQLAAGDRALEYGCGKGGLGLELAKEGVCVNAIDISAAGVELAREAAAAEGIADRVEFEVMNAEELEFPGQHFDRVFGSGILHHLDLPRALTEVARVLKPSGKACFFEPLGHNALIRLYRKLTPKMRSEDEHPLLASDLKNLHRFFCKVEVRYFHLLSLAAIPLRNRAGFGPVLGFLNRMDQILFSLLPFLRKQAWIVVIDLADPVTPEEL